MSFTFIQWNRPIRCFWVFHNIPVFCCVWTAVKFKKSIYSQKSVRRHDIWFITGCTGPVKHSGAVVRTSLGWVRTSVGPEPSYAQLACFPCVCTGSLPVLWLRPQTEDVHVRLLGDFELPVGVTVSVWLWSVTTCDEVATCPGCTLPPAQGHHNVHSVTPS